MMTARHGATCAAWAALGLALGLAGCSTPPKPAAQAPAPAPAPVVVAPPPAPAPAPVPEFTGKVSLASTEREYRRDGAAHLYERYADRIYRGKLPPLLQAVGVMRLTIGPQGELQRLEWMRAPDHVPHVKAEIERLVHAAAPFPAARRLGSVVYTDTWLWDKSGRFQLDTLTEGQLDRLPAAAAEPPKPKARARAAAKVNARTAVAQSGAGPDAAAQAPR
ncbi:hypothetical protein EDC36_1045 [Tepidimonas ignava]|uniref:Uncharacterized protein n=1 Tax=Tepidimonas ignava TaxID=114249 RepID=A0A4R3LEU7_9BURK|nr:hypothetical protein [Tepidimonas ignava]TCS98583.1 hypothetical protein EDC36_1045 [Tepidimonas ignava]TSE20704.1 hypothetical protein Tigna_01897 [Tepidimonas ignava]